MFKNKKELKVYINNEELPGYSEGVIGFDPRETFIEHKIREYTGSFDLIVGTDYIDKVIPTSEMMVKYGDINLFGGIIDDVDMNIFSYDSFTSIDKNTGKPVTIKGPVFRLKIKVSDYKAYAGRRTISAILNIEHEGDLSYAGGLVKLYTERFLSEEGISVGKIVQGGRIIESDLEEFDTMSIAEIFDNLAAIQGHDWHISHDKKLYFGSTGQPEKNHTDPDLELSEKNSNSDINSSRTFFNLSVKKHRRGFYNKLFLIGGDPDEEVDSENLDYDGNLKMVKQIDESIEQLKKLNGGSGVWGRVIRDDNIVTLQDMEYKLINELKRSGVIPIEIYVETFRHDFSPGDSLFVNLKGYGEALTDKIFKIESISIRFLNGVPVYKLKLVNKLNVDVKPDDLIKFLDKLVKEAKKKSAYFGDKDDGGLLPHKNDLYTWIDMQAEDKVVISEGNKVKSILNAHNNNVAAYQVASEKMPSIIERNGLKWLKFDFNNREYMNLNDIRIDADKTGEKYGKSMFIVYRETKPEPYPWNDYCGQPVGNPNYTFNSTIYKNGEYIGMGGTGGLGSKKEIYTLNGSNFSLGIPKMYDVDIVLGGSLEAIPKSDNWLNISAQKNIGFAYSSNPETVGSSNYNKFFSGEIAEIIIYSRALTNDEIKLVNKYLMDKYSIE